MFFPALFIQRQEGKQRKTLYDCRFGSKMPPPQKKVKHQNNIGCDCCKIHAPQDYAKCKVANEIPHGKYIAPCGMSFGASSAEVVITLRRRSARREKDSLCQEVRT